MPHLPIEEWIALLRTFYNEYGYLLVFFSSLAENTFLLGLVLPGGSLVLLGAFYARLGTLNLGLVILFATLGTIGGYHVDYLLGRFVLARPLARLGHTSFGRRLRLRAYLRLSSMRLHKYGGAAILISHLTGHIRSFVAISAGMIRLPYRTFLTFEIIASALWNTLYALLGYFVATQIDQLTTLIQRVGWLLFGIVVVCYLAWYFLGKRYSKRIWQASYRYTHRKRRAEESSANQEHKQEFSLLPQGAKEARASGEGDSPGDVSQTHR
jgi:membrane protein DedA with SNARE-associated domain